MLDMLKIYCKKWKQQKQSEFQKMTQKRPIYNELRLNFESKVNDVQMSLHFRYRFQPKWTKYKIWTIYNKVWYADIKTLWIRPDETENWKAKHTISNGPQN